MFMNQISVYDSDQISAFGFFNINLNLVTSVSIPYLLDTEHIQITYFYLV